MADCGLCAGMSGSRDSLLIAMTTAIWGTSDVQLVDMIRRLVYLNLTQCQSKTGLTDLVDKSDATHLLVRHSDNDVTHGNSTEASQRLLLVSYLKPLYYFKSCSHKCITRSFNQSWIFIVA